MLFGNFDPINAAKMLEGCTLEDVDRAEAQLRAMPDRAKLEALESLLHGKGRRTERAQITRLLKLRHNAVDVLKSSARSHLLAELDPIVAVDHE